MKSTSQQQYKYVAGLIAAALCLLALGYTVYDHTVETSPLVKANPIIPLIAYQFHVYCPIDSASRLARINEALGFSTNALDFDFQVNKQVYVVIARTQPSNSSDPSSPGMLYYCGFVRQWKEQNCQNAKLICSIPGPMFYFSVGQEADIIFVNDINAKVVNWTQSNCYASDSDDKFCTVTTKEIDEGCSYNLPGDYLIAKTGKHRLNSDSVPISPHFHGLEIRPTFDGNPLSWFNTDGETGPGFNTLYNDSYYSLFNNVTKFVGKKAINSQLSKRSKVVHVTNNQLPGMLFYHDHAMKSTRYNVQNGFSGLYIIYDKKTEGVLPSGQFEKFVLFAKSGDARIYVSPQQQEGNNHVLEDGNYRIRMLNAHFADTFYNVSFSAYYGEVTDESGKKTIIEYDPTSSMQYDLTEHQHKIPFSVIGTDTTVFDRPVNDVKQVSLGPAERVDALINFREYIPPNIEYIYIICYDNDEGRTVMKYRFSLPWVDSKSSKEAVIEKEGSDQKVMKKIETVIGGADEVSKRTDPAYLRTLKTNIPFTDLSIIPDSQIAVKRHRPLFSLPLHSKFMIGAHYMFEMGASEFSKIGTIEDFYIVNTLWQAHPIHIHLINYQRVAQYSLKSIPQNRNCTLYMLDYFRFSGLPELQLSNLDLCNYLLSLSDDSVVSLFEKLNSYSLENVTVNRVSGLDSMTPYNGDPNYLVEGCEQWNTVYKYLCGDTSKDIEPYQRKWKDTTLISPFTVAVLRVRWAETSYHAMQRDYPYFSVPEDQLVQFPGFVYHCHILPHEDNEMMRPIALQYSDLFLKRFNQQKREGSCTGHSWLETAKCINEKLGCGAE